MDVAEERILGNQTMGLRLRDSSEFTSVSGSNVTSGILTPKISVAERKTTIMAVTTSGKNFMIDSNGKIEEKGRMDDLDETSSGYSSRESHNGESQDRIQHPKGQKSLKPVIIVKENLKTKETNAKDQVIPIKEVEPVECHSSSSNRLSSSELEIFKEVKASIKQSAGKVEQWSSVASQTDDNTKGYCSRTCKTCSCQRDLGPLRGDQKFFRQPRVDVQIDTFDHLPPDKIIESKGQYDVEYRQNAIKQPKKKESKKKEKSKEIETQTENLEPELLEECSKLRKFNIELEEKLNKSNSHFDAVIKELEDQLISAVREISRLKNQLRAVDIRALQITPCSRCGYCSDGELMEMKAMSKSCRDVAACSDDTMKAISLDNLHIRSRKSQISVETTMLKSLLKGQNPDKIKMKLLEKNKSLKDEIQSLKLVERPRLSSAASSLRTREDTTEDIKYDAYHPTMNRRTSTEPEISLKSKQKPTQEDVRWKQQQQVKIVRRSKKSSTVHPQYTSAAFRTIHVTKWGHKS